jgi:probable rRNA maturation factor
MKSSRIPSEGIPVSQHEEGPAVDVVIASPLWKEQRTAECGQARRAIKAGAAMITDAQGELAVVLTDDVAIRALNRTWRGKDVPQRALVSNSGDASR